MDKQYLIYKCCKDHKKRALVCLRAFDLDEAHEAFKWLQRHHPDEDAYKLEEGEFLEVLEEGHIPPDEWEKAVAGLKTGK